MISAMRLRRVGSRICPKITTLDPLVVAENLVLHRTLLVFDSAGQVGYGRLPADSPESLLDEVAAVAENSLPVHILPPSDL